MKKVMLKFLVLDDIPEFEESVEDELMKSLDDAIHRKEDNLWLMHTSTDTSVGGGERESIPSEKLGKERQL